MERQSSHVLPLPVLKSEIEKSTWEQWCQSSALNPIGVEVITATSLQVSFRLWGWSEKKQIAVYLSAHSVGKHLYNLYNLRLY